MHLGYFSLSRPCCLTTAWRGFCGWHASTCCLAAVCLARFISSFLSAYRIFQLCDLIVLKHTLCVWTFVFSCYPSAVLKSRNPRWGFFCCCLFVMKPVICCVTVTLCTSGVVQICFRYWKISGTKIDSRTALSGRTC